VTPQTYPWIASERFSRSKQKENTHFSQRKKNKNTHFSQRNK
jgi:hypothetical protein